MLKDFKVVPGFYAAGLYVNCDVVNAGLEATGGKTDDKEKFMAALKAVNLKDTPRGPISFDHLGNVVGNFYVRRCEKMKNPYGLKLWNKTVKTYHERQPVLDLAGEGVPRAPGLFAQLSAAEEVLI